MNSLSKAALGAGALLALAARAPIRAEEPAEPAAEATKEPPKDAAPQTAPKDLRRRFLDGVRAFEEHRYDEARKTLEQFLASEPAPSLAFQLLEETGKGPLYTMIKVPMLSSCAKRILALSLEQEEAFEADEEAIRPWVRQLLEGMRAAGSPNKSPVLYWDAKNKLGEVGEAAVPLLISALLETKDQVERARLRQALEQMGRRAILPLVEALDSGHPQIKPFVVETLGSALEAMAKGKEQSQYDPWTLQALGGLLRVAGAAEESPPSREAAAAAVERATGRKPGQLPSWKTVLYWAAERFYRGDVTAHHATVGNARLPLSRIWRWDPAQERLGSIDLTAYRLPDGKTRDGFAPAFLYGDLLAHHNCRRILEGAAHPHPPALGLCAYTVLSQIDRIDLFLAQAGEGQAPPDALEPLAAIRKSLLRDREMLPALGRPALYAALRRALDDHASGVAIQAIRLIAAAEDGGALPRGESQYRKQKDKGREQFFPDSWDPRKEPADAAEPDATPLLDALEEGDAGIRSAAALALVEISPADDFHLRKKVLPVLSQAIAHGSTRSALVISNDPAAYNELNRLLQGKGVSCISALGARSGVDLSRRYPPKDLIFLDSSSRAEAKGKPARPDSFQALSALFSRNGVEAAVDVLRELRNDFRTRKIPVIVLVDAPPEDAEKWSEAARVVQGWEGVFLLPVSPESTRLDAVLKEACPEAGERARDAAEQIAVEAVERVLELSPRCVFTQSLPELMTVIGHVADEPATDARHPDGLRAACLDALGAHASEEAYPLLTRVIANERNSPDVRRSAAAAAGRIIRRKRVFTEPLQVALRAALADPDAGVQQAAALAWAQANFPPAPSAEPAAAPKSGSGKPQ